MNLRYIDWIWRVRDIVPLPPGQSADTAFDRLDPLFHAVGTTYQRAGDTLTFQKKDQASQDKMSVYDAGVLRVENAPEGPVLRYDLTSRALLFCFLMPLLFLGFAQLNIAVGKYEKGKAAAEGSAGKAAEARKKAEAKKKADVPMNPIDKALGAPAPEKHDKDKKDGDDGSDEDGGKAKKRSPTPAYVLAAIFATLYVIGRILEARLVKSLFRKSLLSDDTDPARG